MKERWYYYFRDLYKRPMVSVCLTKKLDRGIPVFCKGIAVCSEKDAPAKKKGRNIAKARAEAAWILKKNLLPIFRDEALEVLEAVAAHQEWFEWYDFKGMFNVELNPYERKLVGV